MRHWFKDLEEIIYFKKNCMPKNVRVNKMEIIGKTIGNEIASGDFFSVSLILINEA